MTPIENNISDNELLEELKIRFESKRSVLEDQQMLLNELKSLNQKLLDSEKLKTNFLSNVRNEIINPVSSVLELAKTINQNGLNIETVKKFCSLIYIEIFKLDFQLRNIFAAAAIEAGECRPHISSVNVFNIIKNVLDAFSFQTERKEIILKINNSIKKNEKFFTDAEKIHLVISNVLANAVQFSNFGGKIYLTCKIENKQLHISIKDEGIGIKEENKKIIFNRFTQLEQGTTKKYAGHGLGLSITKSLLESMNGNISVEGKDGKGSVFTVQLNEMTPSENAGDTSSEGNDLLFNNNECLA